MRRRSSPSSSPKISPGGTRRSTGASSSSSTGWWSRRLASPTSSRTRADALLLRRWHLALVSLPALGPLNVRPRLRRALVELGDELLGRVDKEVDDVLLEPTAKNAERVVILRPLFVTAVLFSHLRLLLGMVRANRPRRPRPGRTSRSAKRRSTTSVGSRRSLELTVSWEPVIGQLSLVSSATGVRFDP